MGEHFWPRLISAGIAILVFVQAWDGKNRRSMINAILLGVLWLALLIPEDLQVARYVIFGGALAAILVRLVKFDLIQGRDTHTRAMAAGMLVFVASLIPALTMGSPPPAWAKYLAITGAVGLMATLLWQLLWITRILFSAHRLYRDLERKRPPREADEKALGIDLSVLRPPDGSRGSGDP
jgi:hypothetical protein